MDISSMLGESVASAIEQCLLAPDSNQFLHSLPDAREKKIISALRKPFSPDYHRELMEAGVPSGLAGEIVEEKKYRFIQEAQSYEEIESSIQHQRRILDGVFRHERPVHVNQNQNIGRQQQPENGEYFSAYEPSRKEEDLRKYCIEELKRRQLQSQFASLENFVIRQLPNEMILNLPLENKKNFLGRSNLVHLFDQEFIADFMNVFLGEMKRDNLAFELHYSYYENLTRDQINALGDKIPQLYSSFHFAQKWFNSNYQDQYEVLSTNNEHLSISEKEEKRRILKEIPNRFTQAIQSYLPIQRIKHQLLIELILIDLSLEDPEIDRFLHYLANMKSPTPLLRDNIKNKIMYENQKHPGISKPICSNLESANFRPHETMENYVVALLKKYHGEEKDALDSKLLKFLDESSYFKIKAKVCLAKGEKSQILKNVLTDSEKNLIKEKKELTILESNVKSFQVEEEVMIKIKAKNISEVVIKIYELNLEKHYLETESEINETVNLHCLEPTFSINYEVDNKDPFKEQFFDITIKEIKKERGIYIIDFDGDGLSSRAIIRKGTIFCLRKLNLAGVELKFYDEKGKRVEELDLWIHNQKVHVNQSYTIPFGDVQQSIKAIVVLGSYAQLLNINIPAENYQLDVSYFYNSESFIVGSKAKIILNPRLSLLTAKEGPQQMNLKLLNNIRIRVEMEDNENIKSSLSLENIEWKGEEDYNLQIPIQNYVQTIAIEGSATVKKYSGKKQVLSFNKVIQISQRSNVESVHDIYLNKSGESYNLMVLGLNGEPIPKINLASTIVYKWSNDPEFRHFQSDKNGKVDLGKLTFVQDITVEDRNNQIYKTWNIDSSRHTANFQNNTTFKEGEKIILPLPRLSYEVNIGSDINLTYLSKAIKPLELCNQNLAIKGRYLSMEGLRQGKYTLTFLSLNVSMLINIVKGVGWETPGQIYNPKKEIVYEFIRSPNHFLMLGDAEIEDKETSKNVSIKVIRPEGVKFPASMKAHIFATNFIPCQDPNNQIPNYGKVKDVRAERFSKKENTYFSNKKLSEEAAYVLHRKNEKQFIGNNLEKPRIFLNRIKVRDTTQKDESMRMEVQYKQQQANMRRHNAQDLLDLDNFQYPSQQQQNYNRGLESLSSHNNFLAEPGFTLSNLKDDIITFQIPSHYNFFKVLLVSNNSIVSQDYNSAEKASFKSKNIRHLGITDEEKPDEAWSMSREIYPMHRGEGIKVNRNSKWCAVSLMNIINFAKAKGIAFEDWVTRWMTYSEETKKKTYSKKVCHELNCYIKHHDPEFFKKCVAPYISNKINKTLVDLCLLEDPKCEKWTSIEYFDQLNDFEKVLLIEYLVKKGNMELAEKHAKSLELQSKIKKQSFNAFKLQFDTMLNAKIGEASSQPRMPPVPPPQPSHYAIFGTQPSQFRNVGGIQPQARMAPPPPPVMGSPPPPPGMVPKSAGFGSAAFSSRSITNNLNDASDDMFFAMDEEPSNPFSELEQRETYKQEFKEVQKTQEFTSITYEGIKETDLKLNRSLIPKEKFWADLAAYLLQGKLDFSNFITDSILYLTTKREFTLAACFLPSSLNAEFEIVSSEQHFQVTAKTAFLLFSKEIKCIPRKSKFGIMVNHRFFDPRDQYAYEDDGTRVEKQVSEFIILIPYSLETVVTNISGTSLDVQLLIDIPQGSIPLRTNEYTQTINVTIPAFSTRSFSRAFYFPSEGEFNFYTTSVSWNNVVIGKGATLPKIKVGRTRTSKELKSFTDVIRSGTKDDILEFLKSKNIFDSNIFRVSEILWMLKDKEMFHRIMSIFRDRGYIDLTSWKYGFYHKDLKTIQEHFVLHRSSVPLQSQLLRVFEYFPYYSSRAHKYLDESRSKIRNVQFKQTYYYFLFTQLCYQSEKAHPSSAFYLALAYYLLLQDRVEEASLLMNRLSDQQKKEHQIQFDYVQCFLDMYEGYPNFSFARSLSEKYLSYPVLNWRELFSEISMTLKEYDSMVYVDEEKKKVDYQTAVFNEGDYLRVSIPANTVVEVLIFPLNMELMFSENPFDQVESFSAVKPAKTITMPPGDPRDEKVIRDEDLKDAIVHVYSVSEGLPSTKVSSFIWQNPKIKVKVNEKKGNIQVFVENKCQTGCYCKVYSTGIKGENFYRDGYTDITGTFKYALSDLQDIKLFSILAVTPQGSVVMKVKPPSQTGLLGMI